MPFFEHDPPLPKWREMGLGMPSMEAFKFPDDATACSGQKLDGLIFFLKELGFDVDNHLNTILKENEGLWISRWNGDNAWIQTYTDEEFRETFKPIGYK